MKRVLVVEDDPMVAMINMEYLSKIDGIEVLGYRTNKNDTLKFLEKESVDLILLDIFLGQENGLDILKEIRLQGYTLDIIMITSANGNESIKKALSLGSIDYLIKPFDFDRFKSAINRFQKRQELLKDSKIIQSDLDHIYLSEDSSLSSLPKGLNMKTLEIVRKEIDSFSGEFNIKDICEATDISNVTIKKYLDYLEKTGEIKGYTTHGNVGRPLFLYNKIKKYPIF